jgi:hypothetical protein
MKMQDFIFHWESGGFNTVMAETLEEAKIKIIEKWGNHGRLVPRMDTVKAVSQKELNSWYSQFD